MSSIRANQSVPVEPRRLLLLRHGEVLSHHGDVAVTAVGLEYAEQVGRNLGSTYRNIQLLCGHTLRTRETAQAIVDGAISVGAHARQPSVAVAMRNPDLYVAGERVDLVSTPAALAAQVRSLSDEQAANVPFFADFFGVPDRIGYWLNHPSPPGEDSSMVAQRMMNFAESLVDSPDAELLTVGITHSPVLRAVALELLGEDPGEPAWLAGLMGEIHSDRSVTFSLLTEVL